MRSDQFYEKGILDFYGDLLAEITEKRDEAPLILKELKEAELFKVDFVYRTLVNTLVVADYYISGRYQEIIPKALVAIEKATNLGLWEFATRNLNTLGASYQILEMLEKALECYREIIKIEFEQDYVDISPLAYNNIGLMYLNLKSYKNAVKYLYKAIELEEKNLGNEKSHRTRLNSFRLHQVIVLSRMGYHGDAQTLFEVIDKENLEGLSPEVRYFKVIAEMNYYFYQGKFDQAKQVFESGLATLGKTRRTWKKAFISEFIELSKEMKLNFAFYLDALLMSEKIEKDGAQNIDTTIYDSLRKYYKQIGNQKLYEFYSEKYLKVLEKRDEYDYKAKLSSLDLVENLIEESKVVSKMKSMNQELKMVADEALQHKKELQKLNKRLNLISDLGKEMTSSLDLTKVIELISKNVYENIPVDTFVIMLAEPEENRLRSLAYYEKKVLQDGFELSFDNPDSISVHCYKTGELIISDNINEDERFIKYKQIYIGENDMKSVVYMPLKVGETMVGVCSVQSKVAGMYQKNYVDFLTMFAPYLSIAINNAAYSAKLEEAIQSQLKVQAKLKKANTLLEQLSSLDGLTRINNRRDFEKKILKLIGTAVSKKTSVAVVMVDIDNFKKFNDTYGHLEGDEALKKVAKVIRTVLEDSGGIAARFGGEEFVGAAAGLGEEEMTEVGRKICAGVYELNIPNEKTEEKRLTVSVGIAFAEAKRSVDKSSLMKEADDALYRAKKSGKNQVIFSKI